MISSFNFPSIEFLDRVKLPQAIVGNFDRSLIAKTCFIIKQWALQIKITLKLYDHHPSLVFTPIVPNRKFDYINLQINLHLQFFGKNFNITTREYAATHMAILNTIKNSEKNLTISKWIKII